MTDYSSLRFNFIQIWRITLRIFIELFLRNDLIKFIQTLQTFRQFFITSSTQHIIFENRASKHFIECRSSSQHLFQHSFHTSFNNLWNNSSSQQLSDRHFIHHTLHTFTTLSQHTFQILHHNNWVTDYLTTLIILCRGVNDRCFILFNNLWTILSQQFHHNLCNTVYESYVNTFSQASSQDLFQQTLNTSSS